MREKGEINDSFRLIYDLQGLIQNEIPDSFLFEKSVSFYICDRNFDDLPTFSDIWAKILQPEFMNALTSNPEMREQTRAEIMKDHEDNPENQENVTKLFSTKVKDSTEIATFKQYLAAQKKDYKEKLHKQLA